MNDKTKAASLRPRSDFFRLLPSIIVVLVSALAIPLSSNTYMSIAAAGICSIYLLAIAKKKVALMLLLLLLFGTLGVPDGLPMISIILALIVGTGTFSFLIAYTRSPYLAIIPVLAFAISTYITRSFVGSLLTLAFALPALFLALSFIKGSARLGALSATSAAFLLSAAVGVAIAMLYFRGELRFDVLRGYANAFKDSFTHLFSETYVELINGETEPLFSKDEARNMALQIVTLFPAIAITFSNIISLFAQKLQFSLAKASLGESSVTSRMNAFILSPAAGITFVLTCLVSFCTNSTPLGYTVSTVCQNIFVILSLPLVGMGILCFLARSATRRVRRGPLLILAFVALFLINFELAFLFIACFGAYASVAIPIKAYLKAKSDKQN